MKGKITMEELVYRAIKNKLELKPRNERREVLQAMQNYIDDYLKQFTLYKLDNIELLKPEIDDLILFLIYEIKSYEIDEQKKLDRIYNDLIDKYERGAITSLDIKDVIYKSN